MSLSLNTIIYTVPLLSFVCGRTFQSRVFSSSFCDRASILPYCLVLVFSEMANRTVKDANTVKGTNPQYLVEKIIRTRVYDSRYWKEECFALSGAGEGHSEKGGAVSFRERKARNFTITRSKQFKSDVQKITRVSA